ncbi:hypothetical protein Nepgr_014569 [Nepenthes gracilis]|uniref:Uncharacterized protein n=1 Tax=Nepenthes gracilis TaxID=150966 RepID=A0AAD3SK88_NEPGR|nr:hypothetical protein Nepgr_014569 [Nepenthes gracilis]
MKAESNMNDLTSMHHWCRDSAADVEEEEDLRGKRMSGRRNLSFWAGCAGVGRNQELRWWLIPTERGKAKIYKLTVLTGPAVKIGASRTNNAVVGKPNGSTDMKGG